LSSSNVNRIQKTHYLADLKKSADTDVCLAGWIHKKKARSDALSITLRDSTGIFEISVRRKSTSPSLMKQLLSATIESTIAIRGRMKDGRFTPTQARILSLAEKKPPINVSTLKTLDSLDYLKERYLMIRHPKMVTILKLQNEICEATREFMRKQKYTEIQAPIIGPATDPGIRGARRVYFDYYGNTRYSLMSSMILYKQMAVCSLERIYAFSPNIRLEPEHSQLTGRHLAEFWQVDIETAFATYEKAMDLAEKLLGYVCKQVKERSPKLLRQLDRDLRLPKIPYKRITYSEAIEILKSLGHDVRFGEEIPWDAEETLSRHFDNPFWITNYPITARGFYYLPNPDSPDLLRDMDLIYPEGYGEAASGGEREYEYQKVLSRIKSSNEDPESYGWYLNMLKYGVPPSAGLGIGLERLTRYICGSKKVWEATPFPKVPGIISP